MQEQFLDYIEKQKLILTNQKILVAVSGGIDSVVLFHLIKSHEFQIGIIHCNFKLRGEESDADETFVASLATKNKVAFFCKHFETEQVAKTKGISIQMAARELRYNWFEQIRKEKNFDRIAIAHNKNDMAETFFINLSRGTGLKGLTGIKAKSGNIIRPLLFVSRDEIKKYQRNNKIQFREDSSNASTKYKRNKIRHDILPHFEKLNPSFLNTLNQNIEILAETESIYIQKKEEIINSICSEENGKVTVNIDRLKVIPERKLVLYEILEPYHFSGKIISDVLQSLDNQSGKKFYSHTHLLIKDRNHLIINTLPGQENIKIEIPEIPFELDFPVQLQFKKELANNYKIVKAKEIAQLDADKIQLPLIIRKWRSGDRFHPLGMKGSKKLSDFFINEKFSLIDKESTWLVCSGEEIIWIIGQRVDDRFKITEKTKNILIISEKVS